MQVTPLLNPSEPAAWSTAYESGSRFVNSSEVRHFAAEISRLVKEVDDTTSQGQRDIQIQLLHVEEQISKMSSISEAMGQLYPPVLLPPCTVTLQITSLCPVSFVARAAAIGASYHWFETPKTLSTCVSTVLLHTAYVYTSTQWRVWNVSVSLSHWW